MSTYNYGLVYFSVDETFDVRNLWQETDIIQSRLDDFISGEVMSVICDYHDEPVSGRLLQVGEKQNDISIRYCIAL